MILLFPVGILFALFLHKYVFVFDKSAERALSETLTKKEEKKNES